MQTVQVSSKYQIVIPKDVRKKLGIARGDQLVVSVEKGKVVLKPKPRDFTGYMLGLRKEIWHGIDATEYVEREREAWGKEQKSG